MQTTEQPALYRAAEPPHSVLFSCPMSSTLPLVSQAKFLTGGGDLCERKSMSPCLLAIPTFERKARLYNRHLNSNRGYAYANDFEVRLRVLTDIARVNAWLALY
jgi:hypothetical protein